MRIATSCLASLGLFLGLALGAGGCFDDPVANDDDSCALGEEGCSCLQNATCFGSLECVQGVCLGGGETGDGDGDPGDGDGDGDGDGEPAENVVVDLFTDACGVTTTWSEHTPDPAAIPCDAPNTGGKGGQMVRYPTLQLGDETFEKVIGLTAPIDVGNEVRGIYNLDDVPNVAMLEFRADVVLRCAEGDVDCTGQFALAMAEGVQGGLYVVLDDRDLASGMAPISVVGSLAGIVTLSEPSLGLAAIQTDSDSGNPPEVLIINPRLVLP